MHCTFSVSPLPFATTSFSSPSSGSPGRGQKATSISNSLSASTVPVMGLTEKVSHRLCSLKSAGALPGLVSVSVSVTNGSMLSSGKRKTISSTCGLSRIGWTSTST